MAHAGEGVTAGEQRVRRATASAGRAGSSPNLHLPPPGLIVAIVRMTETLHNMLRVG
jgi:hypothetical protein